MPGTYSPKFYYIRKHKVQIYDYFIRRTRVKEETRGAVHFIIGKTDIDINLGTVTGIAPYLKSARIS